MAPTHSSKIKRMNAKNGIRLLKPAIGLKRPDRGDKGKYDEKNKCHTNPGDADSTTYEIPMAYFRDRTPKEWLLFKKKLTGCVTDRTQPTDQPSTR